jgi:hypothetical protein
MKHVKLFEDSQAGWGSDPNKPKAIDKIEIKVWKWLNGLKKGWTPNTQNSPRLAKLRREWEAAVEKSGWKPKYYFGDLLA